MLFEGGCNVHGGGDGVAMSNGTVGLGGVEYGTPDIPFLLGGSGGGLAKLSGKFLHIGGLVVLLDLMLREVLLQLLLPQE